MIDRIKALWNKYVGPALLDDIKMLWRKYSGLALPARLLIGGLVSAVGGSGIVGFLSEYAAYSYAMVYGIRPPLEGVPYLRVAITTVTFLVFVGSASVFLALLVAARLTIFAAYRGLRWLFEYLRLVLDQVMWLRRYVPVLSAWMSRGALDLPAPEVFVAKYLAPRSPRQVCLIALLLGLLFGTAVAWNVYNRDGDLTGAIQQGLKSAGFLVTMVVLLWRPALGAWIASIGTVLFFVAAPFGLFHAPSYAKVLRLLGYGGGIPMQVNMLSEAGLLVPAVDGYLVLRTTTTLLLYDDTSTKILEIPVSVVGSLNHDIGGLTSAAWKLPGHSSKRE